MDKFLDILVSIPVWVWVSSILSVIGVFVLIGIVAAYRFWKHGAKVTKGDTVVDLSEENDEKAV